MAFGKLVDMAVSGDMSQLPILTVGMAGLFGISATAITYQTFWPTRLFVLFSRVRLANYA